MIIGVVAEPIAAFWLDRLLKSQLFQVSPTDPLVFGAGVFLLLVVALLAACCRRSGPHGSIQWGFVRLSQGRDTTPRGKRLSPAGFGATKNP
jgi:hypothetical protein